MVYKSQKAAALYSEFANSKNLKEAKIMPGTFNGTTLTISATPVDGALIPDKSATKDVYKRQGQQEPLLPVSF